MTSDPAADLERLVTAAVETPIALGTKLVGAIPGTVSRVQQEVALARFIGKIAVDQGRREIKRRLDGDPPVDRRRPGGPAEQAPAETSAPDDRPAVAEPETDPVEAPPVPNMHDLALADYDQLPASQIVAMLGDLTPAERSAIGDYETAHRNRRTVLGRLAQLA